MSTPGKLQVDTSTGRVTGPASIAYNDPWPCANGSYGSGAMMGLVMHTMVGNSPGSVAWFNNPASQASAHFCIAQDGSVTQMGPIGKGWEAWAEAAGNPTWYSAEHADDGNPANPLTAEQITASAQILECLSAFADFPLQVSNSVSVKGYGWHGMGGVAWGDHPDCPGPVRSAQRAQIVALAIAIRSGGTVTAAPASGTREWTTAGESSLAQLAATLKTTPAGILRLTAVANQAAWPEPIAAWLNDVFGGTLSPAVPMPEGLPLVVPESS